MLRIPTIYFLFLIAICLSCLGTAQAGVIAYYSFDTDFTDASANSNDLSVGSGTPTITSSPGESVFGGGAADFESTISDEEYLDFSTAINFSSTDPWSIAFWVRRRAGSDQRQGMVIGDRTDTVDFLWASDNPSQVQGMRFRSGANNNANFGGFPDDGQYHHWAIIADGAGNVTAFRDNVLQPTYSIDTSFTANTVGQAYSNSTFSMNGQIDELYIFDEAISAGIVESLFNSNAVPEPSSVALLGLAAIAGGCVIRRRFA